MRCSVLAAVLLFACAGRPAGAQVAVGRLAGTVEDQTGGVVPGVHVVVLDAAGHAWGDILTGPDGAYAFANVPAGPATVQAEFEGFRRASRSVRVVAGRLTTVPRLVLEIAGVAQDLTVGPDRTAVSLASDANRDAVVIDAPALRDIPIFDNDVLGTLSRFLDPGSLSTDGATLVVDGMEARKIGVSLSGIQQVRINQDPYAAEFQRPGRGRIEVITQGRQRRVSRVASTSRSATRG